MEYLLPQEEEPSLFIPKITLKKRVREQLFACVRRRRTQILSLQSLTRVTEEDLRLQVTS